MLIVTQKEDAWITIEPADGLDPSMTLREAFAHGPILVKLVHIRQGRVRLGIQAPRTFRISRGRSTSPAFADEVGMVTTTPLAISEGA
jgi:hypothetical protein